MEQDSTISCGEGLRRLLNSVAEIMAAQTIQSEMLCSLLSKGDDRKYDEFTATYSADVAELRKQYAQLLLAKHQSEQ